MPGIVADSARPDAARRLAPGFGILRPTAVVQEPMVLVDDDYADARDGFIVKPSPAPEAVRVIADLMHRLGRRPPELPA